ncbi:glycosyl transferase family 2 [Desulfovibrio subterraneus]|uniref:Glycosyl transferase family 2 n=1 Tax=Desulfovibrio subterraneus TaxID=2718620 RepID=A0A7J0BF43_9BACT|nr:glycosyl transferase family 2 [Desulfovibrio subterraneus]GFM31812.1 hypothetical protein DSM101010T_01770 [Desulfovibrio subterraneus]
MMPVPPAQPVQPVLHDVARLVRDQLHRYSAAVLPFRLDGDHVPPLVHAGTDEAARHVGQLSQALKAAQRAGREHFLLLGAGDGRLSDALVTALPEQVTLTVLEPHPARVRSAMEAGRMQWWRESGRHRLVTDTSSWALLLLLVQAGMTPANTTMMLHPQLTGKERAWCRDWQRLFAGVKETAGWQDSEHDSQQGSQHAGQRKEAGLRPDAPLALGLIAHPDEPNLAGFFAQIPDWLHEVVVVWDAAEMHAVPQAARVALSACAVPVREFARPLGGNFAAQRNAVLDACSTEWIFFLDGDERLSAKGWSALPALMQSGVGGFAFPRWTRMGSEAECRAGFGLWPDVQLRLFRKGKETRFERNVHEVVRNVCGSLGLALTIHIDHYSHLWKDMDILAQKLRAFDEAAGRNAMHRLSEEYPAVPCELFGVLEGLFKEDRFLLLPVAT